MDRILSQIGEGPFLSSLFILCGMGWIADNMWLQSVVAILPLYQESFQLSSSTAAVASSCLFVGLSVGSLLWGTISDSLGRRIPFLSTLLLSGIAGILSSLAPSYVVFCISLSILAVGVGGSLPTDGSLLLEFSPPGKEHLLVLMSVFWPIGQLIVAIVCWSISLLQSQNDLAWIGYAPGSPHSWRIILLILSVITLIMAFTRYFAIKPIESPRFLLAAGKYSAAVNALKELAKANNKQIDLSSFLQSFPLHSPNHAPNSPRSPTSPNSDHNSDNSDPESNSSQSSKNSDSSTDSILQSPVKDPSSFYASLMSHLNSLFAPNLRSTTILIWIIWTAVSLGYVMFNGFITKYLKEHGSDSPEANLSDVETYKRYAILSICGIPGSIIASYTTSTRLARLVLMTVATLGTSVSLVLFVIFTSPSGQLIVGCLESLLQNVMYGLLYTYTPEVFPPNVRGTAVGIASSLSRIAAMVAPVIAGYLLESANNNPMPPVLASSVAILVAFVCMGILIVDSTRRRRQE